jgi:hypothetical protein
MFAVEGIRGFWIGGDHRLVSQHRLARGDTPLLLGNGRIVPGAGWFGCML